VIPLPTELSLKTLPSAVAIAICAEGSVGSGAVVGFRRISSIDGNWRNSPNESDKFRGRCRPHGSIPGDAPQNSLVPERNCAFLRRAMPQSTCEAICQERGVGQALASEVVSAVCRSSGLKRRKAIISGRT